jgi:VanZ family protein
MKKMLQANWLKSKGLAIGWLLLMCILFVIPGSALPEQSWFADIQLDKWVHIGLFSVLIFLWCSSFQLGLPGTSWIIIIIAIFYGILVEFVQKTWIPKRTFDLYDVLAYGIGSIVGLVVLLRVNRKK